MAKTFKDLEVGDTLYEIKSSDFNIVKVTGISRKGKKTMTITTDDHSYGVRVDLDSSRMLNSTLWFKWFINKEDAPVL